MHIPFKKQWAAVLIGAATLAGCTKALDQVPQSSATQDAVFSSEAGLKLYTTSFYNILPDINTPYKTDANLSDFGATTTVPDYILANSAYTSRTETGWTWSDLRNVNYFIVNCNNPAVTQAVRENYIGIARFFRAYFYYEKVKRYGDVPWINRPLGVNDSALYAARDPRVLVMDSVLADLDYACTHITATDDATRSTITQAVAYGFKSRVCLYEGTFRKYNTQYNLPDANKWLQAAATAAKVVIDGGKFSLNQGTQAYRNLFISAAPVTSEIMLADIASSTLGKTNDANWFFTSATYGNRFSFIRKFVNTYLNIDGTPFTSTPGYQTMTLSQETKNRDLRLSQTIRVGNYQRTSSGKTLAAPPVFSYTYTGYQPIKWALDDMYYDAGALSTNSVSLMRYAEILLNYAEAQSELGVLSGGDWATTIGALRARAGITNTAQPTVADAYLQTNYFPNVTDPSLLEIRRERGIELALEGFRYNDLIRWNRGALLLNSWNGMYVPAINTPMDLNGDGINDVYFYQDTPPSPQDATLTYINVGATVGGVTNPLQLSNGTYGELHWLNNINRGWYSTTNNDPSSPAYQYKVLYAIPFSAIQLNSKLTQNPGWENF